MHAIQPSNRNGVLGFFAAFGFLGFVSIFNDFVSSYKEKHAKNKRRGKGGKGPKPNAGLFTLLRRVLGVSCNARELNTVMKLALCLLLRTIGSVWVSKHWGRIVGALVTRKFPDFKSLVTTFAGTTM